MTLVRSLFLLPMVWTVAPAAAQDAPLAPHRAVYELTLVKGAGAKAPVSARGRIAFDFTGSSCEGYAMSFRQLTELQPQEGPSRTSDMRSTTFEDGDGAAFQFKVSTEIEGTRAEDVDGRASRSGDGALSVALARPRAGKYDFDQGILFPTEHLKLVLAAARRGDPTLSAQVYDGSDSGDKIYDTLAVIGPRRKDAAVEPAAMQDGVRDMPRWPVTISYFDSGKKDGAPNYVLSFDLYDNGVSRALKLDYGDFVLAGEMTKLDLLPAKPCAK